MARERSSSLSPAPDNNCFLLIHGTHSARSNTSHRFHDVLRKYPGAEVTSRYRVNLLRPLFPLMGIKSSMLRSFSRQSLESLRWTIKETAYTFCTDDEMRREKYRKRKFPLFLANLSLIFLRWNDVKKIAIFCQPDKTNNKFITSVISIQ